MNKLNIFVLSLVVVFGFFTFSRVTLAADYQGDGFQCYASLKDCQSGGDSKCTQCTSACVDGLDCTKPATDNSCQQKCATDAGSKCGTNTDCYIKSLDSCLTGCPAANRGNGIKGGAGGSSTTDFSLQPYGPKSFTNLLNVIITWIFNIAIPIAVIMIIWSGLLMLTAGAKPAQYEKGKKMLGWAVLGLAVIFIGKGFISLIKSILELSSQ